MKRIQKYKIKTVMLLGGLIFLFTGCGFTVDVAMNKSNKAIAPQDGVILLCYDIVKTNKLLGTTNNKFTYGNFSPLFVNNSTNQMVYHFLSRDLQPDGCAAHSARPGNYHMNIGVSNNRDEVYRVNFQVQPNKVSYIGTFGAIVLNENNILTKSSNVQKAWLLNELPRAENYKNSIPALKNLTLVDQVSPFYVENDKDGQTVYDINKIVDFATAIGSMLHR
jgi:hypothetical protein